MVVLSTIINKNSLYESNLINPNKEDGICKQCSSTQSKHKVYILYVTIRKRHGSESHTVSSNLVNVYSSLKKAQTAKQSLQVQEKDSSMKGYICAYSIKEYWVN